MLRTALLKNGNVYIQAGGGWVADSVPADEYQETINKASASLRPSPWLKLSRAKPYSDSCQNRLKIGTLRPIEGLICATLSRLDCHYFVS